MRHERLHVELRDTFGAVFASGVIEVNPAALTPAEIAPDGRIVSGKRERLAEAPVFPAVICSNYVQDKPLNPALPLYIVVSLMP